LHRARPHLRIRPTGQGTLLAGVAVLHKESNRGNGTVSFTNVDVPRSGTYQVEIGELRSEPGPFFVSINGGASFHLSSRSSSRHGRILTIFDDTRETSLVLAIAGSEKAM
jgi:hypothetical protein